LGVINAKSKTSSASFYHTEYNERNQCCFGADLTHSMYLGNTCMRKIQTERRAEASRVSWEAVQSTSKGQHVYIEEISKQDFKRHFYS